VSDLERVSFTIEASLLERLEGVRSKRGYENRSELIRDVIRERLVQDAWEDEQTRVVGTVTLVFDHHRRRLGEKLTEIQHEHHDHVLATMHVHLDRDLCAETILLHGPPRVLRSVADALIRQKGVLHGELTLTSSGKELL
jgi:CopG family nickel-responsive transcriptional regulator